MKVVLEASKCVGHGRCEGAVPTVFEVADEGFVTIHADAIADVDPAEIRAAVALCPSEALTIEE